MNNFLRKVGSKCFSLFFPRLTDLERRLQKVYDVKEQWRKLNKHNYTTVSSNVYDLPFPISKVKVGNYTYGSLHVYSYDSDDEQLIIGSFCSIAPDVSFILGGMHHCSNFSTYPFKYYFKNVRESFSKGPLIIEDDVWIGQGAIIMAGVRIAKGSIIAAGSVVVKSTKPYSIVGGNPAKLIRYRFDKDIVDLMATEVDYSKFSDKITDSLLDTLYSTPNKLCISKINNHFSINTQL